MAQGQRSVSGRVAASRLLRAFSFRRGERQSSALHQDDVLPTDVSMYVPELEDTHDAEPVRFPAYPLAAVYPWTRLRPLRVYVPSPWRQRVALRQPGVRRAFARLTVRVPAKLMFCVRRKIRKQVLFAYGRAGYRGSAPKRHYRRTADSQWRC